jgi:hypothetical protein
MRLAIILMAVLAFAASTAWPAGCPAGTKQRCVQTKKGVECYCR